MLYTDNAENVNLIINKSKIYTDCCFFLLILYPNY